MEWPNLWVSRHFTRFLAPDYTREGRTVQFWSLFRKHFNYLDLSDAKMESDESRQESHAKATGKKTPWRWTPHAQGAS